MGIRRFSTEFRRQLYGEFQKRHAHVGGDQFPKLMRWGVSTSRSLRTLRARALKERAFAGIACLHQRRHAAVQLFPRSPKRKALSCRVARMMAPLPTLPCRSPA